MALSRDAYRMRDREWVDREVHRARALLIMAATHGQTVRYGELSPLGDLRWYDRRVLGGVSDLSELHGEPDLTAILVLAGQPPEDAQEAAAVFEYWRQALALSSAAHSSRRRHG
jgi:hypothetical protein